jgi:hypothetical protein
VMVFKSFYGWRADVVDVSSHVSCGILESCNALALTSSTLYIFAPHNLGAVHARDKWHFPTLPPS